MAKPKSQFNDIEEALSRLNEIEKLIEKPNVKLNDAIALYEEGSQIILWVQKQLNGAKQKITVIKDKIDKELESAQTEDDDEE
jgi:exodeoxyribonuclease VII small subunit